MAWGIYLKVLDFGNAIITRLWAACLNKDAATDSDRVAIGELHFLSSGDGFSRWIE